MLVGCTLCVKAIQQNQTSQVMLQGQAAPNSKWLITGYLDLTLFFFVSLSSLHSSLCSQRIISHSCCLSMVGQLRAWLVEHTPSGYQVTK